MISRPFLDKGELLCTWLRLWNSVAETVVSDLPAGMAGSGRIAPRVAVSFRVNDGVYEKTHSCS